VQVNLKDELLLSRGNIGLLPGTMQHVIEKRDFRDTVELE
jgi:hypothetical protein